jgi:hypothetical protein
VLLDGAVMPSEDALPDDLKSLARRHALELRYTRFNADAQGLEVALREILPYRRPKWFFPALCGGVAVLCIAAFVGWRVLSPHDGGLGGQGVGSPPAVQPAIKPEPVKPVTPPVQPARRALESTATSSGLLVALGDSMDHVKSV